MAGCCFPISRGFEWYSRLVTKHPFKFLVGYYVLGTLLSVAGVYFGLETISRNPHEGFETRATAMADDRLALSQVAAVAMPPQKLTAVATVERRQKREIPLDASEEPTAAALPFTINYDDYGREEELTADEITSGCVQYFALGKYFPTNVLDLLSKVIFEVESVDQAFSLPVMQRLCRLDELVDETIAETGITAFRTALPFSFNLPHYALCVNQTFTKRCADLNERDLRTFKTEVLKCARNPTDAQSICNTTIAQQLGFLILQKDADEHTAPLHIGALLRVQLRSGVSADGQKFFDALLHKLRSFYDRKQGGVQLRGLNTNSKEATFLTAIIDDCFLAAAAVVAVIFGIFLFSRSLVFSAGVAVGMILSIGVAFFLYVCVLQIHFFPFINLLAVVVSIVIGVDDALLLAFQFASAKQHERYASAINLHSFENKEMKQRAMQRALGHAGVAMFVTSATTVVAFFTNCTSKIVVLKCFGLFAGLTIGTNYLFAITGMPALILVLPTAKRSDWWPSKWTRAARWVVDEVKNAQIYALPKFVHRIRFLLLIFFGFLSAFCLYSLLVHPGIRLPDRNPMQLLRSSHVYEWFDEHELELFDFSHYRTRQMNFYVLWGVRPTTDASTLDPRDTGRLHVDREFERLLRTVRQSEVTRADDREGADLWISELLRHAEGGGCSRKEDPLNFSLCARDFARRTPVFRFPDDFSMSLKDGPIFHKETKVLMAYFMLVPSNHRLLFVYSKITPFLADLEKLRGVIGGTAVNKKFLHPLVVPTDYLSRMGDLLGILLNSTIISVLICVGVSMVVILGTTRHVVLSTCAVLTIGFAIGAIVSCVLWMGWYVNVVEATIVVITIGLSFDYTLHLTVAFKMTPTHLTALERMIRANEEVHVPVFMAAATNGVSGLVLLFAQTQPFYEIGVFLLLCAGVSYAAAFFLCPALIFTFYRLVPSIKRCD
ncbi:SSD domain-containing protein [Aphelenchoides fujianensis]|nr:SSD domain-containing protein [Aphelenchoides fujianensis]